MTRQLLIGKLTLLLLIAFISCKKSEDPGRITLKFEHDVDKEPLVKDQAIYTNAAGNIYEVNEIQYFISEVKFWKGGSYIEPDSDAIHYVDIDIPTTLEWKPETDFSTGSYDSVTFICGLDEVSNVSGRFPNPPERDMFWPDMMGGGYHYMKINGKWKALSGTTEPFNLHLGKGMEPGSMGAGYIHNHFNVSLPLTNCVMAEGSTLAFSLTMAVDQWFKDPYLWNWNVIGGQIMQNQEAMYMASMNGRDAFSINFVKQ